MSKLQNFIKTVVIAGTIALAPPQTNADPLYTNGILSLNDTDWGYSITEEVVRAGELAQRFEVRSGDCTVDPYSGWDDCANDRERSEISLNEELLHGENHWIGFSVYLPERFLTSMRVNSTVGQLKMVGGPVGTAGGLPSEPPIMGLEMREGMYFLRIHDLSGSANDVTNEVIDYDLISIDNMRGRWTDIVINLDTSREGGRLSAYVNGRKIVEHDDFINFVPESYYFKYGIYRTFVSRHGAPMPTQIIYVDEVRIGDGFFDVLVNERDPED